MAWFWMRPVDAESTVTRNATVTDVLTSISPPVVPFAPVPRRTRTVRDAARYSPWSSPVASVLVPAFAPEVTRIEPDTNVRPEGSASLSTTLVALSLPVLVAEIVYSTTSPGRTAPFGCDVRSAMVFVAPPKSGLYVEMEVMNAPRR
jgi:hypothetical protein